MHIKTSMAGNWLLKLANGMLLGANFPLLFLPVEAAQ
jgi:hypothetical protein